MSGASSNNKRKYPRVEGKGVGAYLRLNGHNAGCTVENISVGGVFVRTDRFLPVGTKLAFDLVRSGMKKALTVSGWVVGVITPELAARTRLPQGLRIQFAKMNPMATEALQELVGSLRRNTAEPPVLYPLEERASSSARPKRASGMRRPPTSSPPALEPARRSSRALVAAPRPPSRALADSPAMSTEVEMEAAGKERSVAQKWFAGDEEATHDGRGLFPDDSGGEERGEAGGGGMDDLLDAFPEDAAAQFQKDVRAAERAHGRGEDKEGEDLRETNQELHRLLGRREQEIAALRSQLAKAETQLKEKDEQLQLAKRVLKSNGLG